MPSPASLSAAARHRSAISIVATTVTSDPDRSVAAIAKNHDVRDVERRFLLDDSARALRAARLAVTLDDIEPLDHYASAIGQHAHHLAGLAAVAAGDDHHGVILLDFILRRRHHSTSGASEIIFRNFLARSSRATGPKMRVPIGS